MNAEAIVARIRQLLDWQQLSPTQFADRIGVGRPVISHILGGRNKASLEVALRISETFPELSLDWLLKGTGQMLAPLVPAPVVPPALTPAATQVIQEVPVLPATSASALAAAPPVRSASVPRPSVPRFQPSKGAKGTSATELAAATASVVPTPLAPQPPSANGEQQPIQPVATETASASAPIATPLASRSEPSAAGSTAMPPPAAELVGAGSPLAGFAEPGKPIRRIVIFYRDGSFADYQPES